ncbi:signal recognition particle-docking protein FtsY [Weissella coleopterorum]|uniref:Signal recognition particle receptor FtsY n=1 Tax=Weissella coleopterorum TaxID=2714949 RepID=A0A6G8B0K8_9LACO|nr:signal recognition particle-docking protein FtsY [Weissella coleopterorum]QIL50663.1 signal recognition particle-docking protein FtsY [Weissella coleopterorum]
MGLFDAIKKAFTGDVVESTNLKPKIEVVTLYPRITADTPFQPKIDKPLVKVERLMPNKLQVKPMVGDLESKVELDVSAVNSAEIMKADVSELNEIEHKEVLPGALASEPIEAGLTDQGDDQDTAVEKSAIQAQEVVTSESNMDEMTQTDETDLDQGLHKTKKSWSQRWNEFMSNFRRVDEDFFDDLEETLIKADVGAETAFKLTDELRNEVKLQNAKSKEAVSKVILQKLIDHYTEQGRDEDASMHFATSGPTVILFVGVNGVGKTTTIGKLAARYKHEGKKVLLAAADTFRAGATQQLQVWGERDGVEVIVGPPKSDPASVVYDGVKAAIAQEADILFVDTAGRLQNNVNLMQELSKMKRIIERELPDQPAEVLLVLDSTTGQNALQQAKLFKDSTDVTGIVLTKLDGTAKGGIVLPIRNELHLPVKWIGLGEQVGDLKPFDANDFAKSLFGPLLEL